jgi:hypothetical protein
MAELGPDTPEQGEWGQSTQADYYENLGTN